MTDATEDLDFSNSGEQDRFRKRDRQLWEEQKARGLLNPNGLQANKEPKRELAHKPDTVKKIKEILDAYRKVSFAAKPFIADRDKWAEQYAKNHLAELQKATQAIQRLLLSERIEELLGADDEVRLHNKVDGSYQAWFEARLATLQEELEKK